MAMAVDGVDEHAHRQFAVNVAGLDGVGVRFASFFRCPRCVDPDEHHPVIAREVARDGASLRKIMGHLTRQNVVGKVRFDAHHGIANPRE